MKVDEAVRTALATNDGRLACRVADTLRFRGGLTYDRMMDLVAKVSARPRADVEPEWEALLADGDNEEG